MNSLACQTSGTEYNDGRNITRFRELSVYNQGECFLSPVGRNNFCVKSLLFNLSNKLEAKFWLFPGKLNCGKLT